MAAAGWPGSRRKYLTLLGEYFIVVETFVVCVSSGSGSGGQRISVSSAFIAVPPEPTERKADENEIFVQSIPMETEKGASCQDLLYRPGPTPGWSY